MIRTVFHVPYTYLSQEFGSTVGPSGSDNLHQRILTRIAHEMDWGRYTLGPAVQEFEERFADLVGVKYAVGVNSGTDALFLLLKTLVRPGEAVITTPNTFVATAGAILAAGCTPVFLDIGDDYQMLPEGQWKLKLPQNVQLSSYPRYRLPVHWGGNIAHTDRLHIEDACQAIGASYKGRKAGSLGVGAAFSLHPLKNLNIMGDGGMVTTNDEGVAQHIRLLRNHGLQDRDTCVVPGYNSRLDTIQAIVGLEVLEKFPWVTERRIANAARYDAGLSGLREVTIPPRDPDARQVYHLYQVEVERRDDLLAYLQANGIEAKVHYPIPLHRQPGLAFLGYEAGDFPRAEWFAANHITLPVHQYLSTEQIDYVVETIGEFYTQLS